MDKLGGMLCWTKRLKKGLKRAQKSKIAQKITLKRKKYSKKENVTKKVQKKGSSLKKVILKVNSLKITQKSAKKK